jgi:hypothetical protein
MSFEAVLVEKKNAVTTNRAVPLAELDATMQTLAEKILVNSRGSLAAYKVLYNQGIGKTVTEAVEFEKQSKFVIEDSNERVEKFR